MIGKRQAVWSQSEGRLGGRNLSSIPVRRPVVGHSAWLRFTLWEERCDVSQSTLASIDRKSSKAAQLLDAAQPTSGT